MTVADLRYDPFAHRSFRPDGTEVPHVTAILKACGLTEDFEALIADVPNLEQRICEARARGRAVHDYCHAYDDDDLDRDRCDERIVPWVDAWAVARQNLRLTPVLRERNVYSEVFGFTGIFDGVFARHVGLGPTRHVLIDIKTGDPDDAAGHLQTAAYEIPLREAGVAIDERWAIWLQPGAKVPYRVVDYTIRPVAYMDTQKFLAALTVYSEQPARRRVA